MKTQKQSFNAEVAKAEPQRAQRRSSFAIFAVFCATLLLLPSVPIFAADSVASSTLSITNKREQAAEQITWGDNLWQGGTLLLTNCQIFADSTGTTTQGLDGITVTVSAGNSTTNLDYTATVTSAANGQWHCTVTNLSVDLMQFQVKIVDGDGNTYIYGIKQKQCLATMF